MTQDAYALLSTLMRQLWRLFSEWYLPGTNVTPAGFLLLVAFLAIIIRFLKRITWTTFDGQGQSKAKGDD